MPWCGALKWLQTASPSDIVRAVPEAYMHGDRAIYLAAFEKSREALSPDGMGIERAIQNAHAAAAQFGLQQQPAVRPPAPGATYTNEFVLRARQRVQAMLWAGGGRRAPDLTLATAGVPVQRRDLPLLEDPVALSQGSRICGVPAARITGRLAEGLSALKSSSARRPGARPAPRRCRA
jgi:hypothetical protein